MELPTVQMVSSNNRDNPGGRKQEGGQAQPKALSLPVLELTSEASGSEASG